MARQAAADRRSGRWRRRGWRGVRAGFDRAPACASVRPSSTASSRSAVRQAWGRRSSCAYPPRSRTARRRARRGGVATDARIDHDDPLVRFRFRVARRPSGPSSVLSPSCAGPSRMHGPWTKGPRTDQAPSTKAQGPPLQRNRIRSLKGLHYSRAGLASSSRTAAFSSTRTWRSSMSIWAVPPACGASDGWLLGLA